MTSRSTGHGEVCVRGQNFGHLMSQKFMVCLGFKAKVCGMVEGHCKVAQFWVTAKFMAWLGVTAKVCGMVRAHGKTSRRS